MKTITISSGFTAYPNGKDKRQFAKGEEHEVADAFADLITGKGLATEKVAKAEAKPVPAAKTSPGNIED